MKSLSSVVVTSSGFLIGLGAVLLVVLAATAVLLERRARAARAARPADRDAPAGSAAETAGGKGASRPVGRRRRRGLVLAVVALVVCQLLTVSFGAARINAGMRFATTLGDVAGLVSGSSSTRTAQLGDQTPQPTDAGAPSSAWVATMSLVGHGFTKTTFTGPISGISQEVWVWTPQGYSPTDGKTYDVIVFLHGDPGTPDGTAQALNAADTMQKAIDDGSVPPSLLVIPSLNADDTQRTQPDCANIVGHAQVGTWIQAEVPAMVRATFPNVTSDRHGWAIAGLSSGAYCALWTGIHRSDVYGTVMAMSGYDAPVLGGMSTTDRLRQQNTITTLLAHTKHEPLDIWVMGAKDDPDAMAIVQKLPTVAPPTDHVTPVLLESGGHSWTLWSAQFPGALSWWGTTLRGEPAATTPAPTTGPTTASPAPGGSGSSAGGGLGAGVVASLTGIKGNGLLAVLTVLATVLSVAAVRSWGDLRLPARLRRPGRRVGPVRPGRRSGPTRVAPAPRSARREVAAEVARAGARTLVIVASCLVVALLAGVVANRLGDFYPSWSLAWSDLGTALL